MAVQYASVLHAFGYIYQHNERDSTTDSSTANMKLFLLAVGRFCQKRIIEMETSVFDVCMVNACFSNLEDSHFVDHEISIQAAFAIFDGIVKENSLFSKLVIQYPSRQNVKPFFLMSEKITDIAAADVFLLKLNSPGTQ
jgi:hypothetical protein